MSEFNHLITNDEILKAGYSFHMEPYHLIYEQGTKYYLLRLQMEGEATIRINQQSLQVTTGDFLIVRPDEPYELHINPIISLQKQKTIGSGDYYLFCKNAWIEEWWNSKSTQENRKVSLDDGILGIWKQIILEKQRGENESKEILNGLLRILCLSIDRSLAKPNAVQPKNSSFIVYQIKDFVEVHAHTSFTLETAAKHIGISVSSAVQLFKSHFGKTIMEYALEIRLRLAMERMSSSQLTLEQIAECSGFQSYSYFHRVFRERYGIPPKEYRNKIRLENARAGI